MHPVHIVFPAAGVGKRFGSELPKQYYKIHHRMIMQWTLDVFSSAEFFGQKVIALQPTDEIGQAIIRTYADVKVCDGGEERSDSVLNALHLLKDQVDPEDWVLVHDIARPCIRLSDVNKLVQYCQHHNTGAVLARPITDTVKQLTTNGSCTTIDRSTLWTVQTPQCFRLGMLLDSLAKCQQQCKPVTDEASAIEAFGGSVHLVEGSSDNIKLTHADDVFLIKHFLAQQERT